ncbi:MAG: MsnO8 family LLM class oxidoreductase [Aerococcus sp.]|nr:MsnO8 family LLM class oxidoreductase [Aerococcus sp.]
MGQEIGILDFIPRDHETNAIEAFQNSTRLLKQADKLGLGRYWYAEHHTTPSILGSSPLTLVGHGLALTSQIKIGTGGVMLDNISAFQLAEHYKVLDSLAPGRVDAGVGYSNRKEQDTQEAMGGLIPKQNANYEEAMQSLSAYMSDYFPPDFVGPEIHVMPMTEPHHIPLYGLVGSRRNAKFLAENGWDLVFGLFLSPNLEECRETIRIYRENFKPNRTGQPPRVIVALYVVSSPTYADIPAMERSVDHWIYAFGTDKRQIFELLPLGDAEHYPLAQAERDIIDRYRDAKVVGRPREIQAQLRQLKRELGCDEFMVVNQLPGFYYRSALVDMLSEIKL